MCQGHLGLSSQPGCAHTRGARHGSRRRWAAALSVLGETLRVIGVERCVIGPSVIGVGGRIIGVERCVIGVGRCEGAEGAEVCVIRYFINV